MNSGSLSKARYAVCPWIIVSMWWNGFVCRHSRRKERCNYDLAQLIRIVYQTSESFSPPSVCQALPVLNPFARLFPVKHHQTTEGVTRANDWEAGLESHFARMML